MMTIPHDQIDIELESTNQVKDKTHEEDKLYALASSPPFEVNSTLVSTVDWWCCICNDKGEIP
jgi:hypothetical protein